MVVWFDMNNVICDFYKVENVYARLDNGDNSVYLEANTIPEGVASLRRYKEWGYKVGIITRLSKKLRSEKIDIETYINKYNWLVHNGINVDVFKLIPYEDNKWDYRESDDDIIVDDDERVWRDWGNYNIMRVNDMYKIERVGVSRFAICNRYGIVVDKYVYSTLVSAEYALKDFVAIHDKYPALKIYEWTTIDKLRKRYDYLQK